MSKEVELRVTIAIIALALAWPETPLAQTPTERYPPTPETLSLPSALDFQTVRDMRGNLARWRDEERMRLGAFDAQDRRVISRRQDLEAMRGIQAVSGYFAFFGNADYPAGIVHGRWFDPGSEIAAESAFFPAYAVERRVCGARLVGARAAITDATFLGPTWRDDFSGIEHDLERGDTDRGLDGHAPAEGVSVTTVRGLRDLGRFYPDRALEREITGIVALNCLVRPSLNLVCGVTSEEPPGYKFGIAAWRALSYTRVSPTATDGSPSLGICLRRVLRFDLFSATPTGSAPPPPR